MSEWKLLHCSLLYHLGIWIGGRPCGVSSLHDIIQLSWYFHMCRKFPEILCITLSLPFQNGPGSVYELHHPSLKQHLLSANACSENNLDCKHIPVDVDSIVSDMLSGMGSDSFPFHLGSFHHITYLLHVTINTTGHFHLFFSPSVTVSVPLSHVLCDWSATELVSIWEDIHYIYKSMWTPFQMRGFSYFSHTRCWQAYKIEHTAMQSQ